MIRAECTQPVQQPSFFLSLARPLIHRTQGSSSTHVVLKGRNSDSFCHRTGAQAHMYIRPASTVPSALLANALRRRRDLHLPCAIRLACMHMFSSALHTGPAGDAIQIPHFPTVRCPVATPSTAPGQANKASLQTWRGPGLLRVADRLPILRLLRSAMLPIRAPFSPFTQQQHCPSKERKTSIKKRSRDTKRQSNA
ncbi:unnamed protein product [Periconia digitata]|uniref:Uncharacterized protein n=1 Tax=Periconia digitata TaxID=1303443 RepID=A0A9W4XW47_9PLEO|nr:unnamed protein product [Periconia digitata]